MDSPSREDLHSGKENAPHETVKRSLNEMDSIYNETVTKYKTWRSYKKQDYG